MPGAGLAQETPVKILEIVGTDPQPVFSGPASDTQVIDQLAAGDRVVVTGLNPEGNWWRVVCGENQIGQCWVPVDSDRLRPVLDLSNFQVERVDSGSPDGSWTSQSRAAFPPADETEFQGQYYTQLLVTERASGEGWLVVSELADTGLGYTVPQSLQWSQDGRSLYLTNVPRPDGCAIYVNGSDLARLDLETGQLVELVPTVGLWLALSPDESRLAYIGSYGRGLVIRDLANGEEVEFSLDPGKPYAAGEILWEPEGGGLLLAVANMPCMGGEQAASVSIMRLDLDRMELIPLVEEDARLFSIESWLAPGQVWLRDKVGLPWILNLADGSLE